MRACVVLFPGSNADAEMKRTLETVCGVPTEVVWHADTELPAGVDLVTIPGGFSYGDYLRCGALARTSPILGAIRKHAERGGYVLGVCNGFQILTEVGLLPGALTRNAGLHFICRDLYLRVESEGPFTPAAGRVLRLPVAHGEGRYQASARVIAELEGEGRIGLRYATSSGVLDDLSNPNGSVSAIAGIYGGPKKNVFGLMPHPERMSEALHGGTDGRCLFDRVVRAA